MKSITAIAALLALLGTLAVFWQHRSFSKIRESVGVGFTREIPTSPAEATKSTQEEILALRDQTRDLAKLRNEASGLRATRTELSAARAEAAQLLEAKESRRTPAPLPPEFIPRQQLVNAGFATPEAALQTFFWAMSEKNLDVLLRAVLPAHVFNKLTPEERLKAARDFELDLNSMAHFNNFGIRHREQISEDKVVLHVGSSLSTNTMRMAFKRVGGEWKPD